MEKERVKFVLNHLDKLESTIMDYNSLIHPFLLDYTPLDNMSRFNTNLLSLIKRAETILSSPDLTGEQLRTKFITEIKKDPYNGGFWAAVYSFVIPPTQDCSPINFKGSGQTIIITPSQTSPEPQGDESDGGVDQTPEEAASSKIDGNNEV